MLKFSEFIKESSHEEVIDTDQYRLESNTDTINAELEVLTTKPYQNAPIFLNQLRGCFERFGILIPASATDHFLNLSAELVYAFDDSGSKEAATEGKKYLYIVYDTNDDGFVDGYAQIVSKDELDDLEDMGSDGVLNTGRKKVTIRPSDWYRKRDDDAGNSNEY